MKSLVDKMNRAHSNYLSKLGAVESMLSDKIDFDFSIDYIPGDGFVVLDYDASNVASLSTCIEIIKKKGILTKDDHKQICV
jgi:hypothetical protein